MLGGNTNTSSDTTSGTTFNNGATAAVDGKKMDQEGDEEPLEPTSDSSAREMLIAQAASTACSFDCRQVEILRPETFDPTTGIDITKPIGGGFLGAVAAGAVVHAIQQSLDVNQGEALIPEVQHGPTILNDEKVSETTVPRPEGVPDNWIEKSTKATGGKQYVNPENPHDRVRVMPGDPNSPNPAQQQPYVKDQINGRFLTKSGDRVQGGKAPETHIPIDDYQFGR